MGSFLGSMAFSGIIGSNSGADGLSVASQWLTLCSVGYHTQCTKYSSHNQDLASVEAPCQIYRASEAVK